MHVRLYYHLHKLYCICSSIKVPSHVYIHACTYLILGDVIRVPQALLKVIVERSVFRISNPNLHSAPGLKIWPGSCPIRRVITLFPSCHHKMSIVVVVVYQTKIIIVHCCIHKECTSEIKTSESCSTQK